jgi:DNA topoisomerase-3
MNARGTKAASATRSGRADSGIAVTESEPQIPIEEALRAWRLREAKHRKIPVFRIFGNRTLRGIASTRPRNDAELLAVLGIGMSNVTRYGAHIYRLIAVSS